RRAEVTADLSAIREVLGRVKQSPSADALRGLEGTAARHYFHALPALLSTQVPESLRFDGRNRRPPTDRFNAALSFGYSMVHTTVTRSILAVGLEPALG